MCNKICPTVIVSTSYIYLHILTDFMSWTYICPDLSQRAKYPSPIRTHPVFDRSTEAQRASARSRSPSPARRTWGGEAGGSGENRGPVAGEVNRRAGEVKELVETHGWKRGSYLDLQRGVQWRSLGSGQKASIGDPFEGAGMLVLTYCTRSLGYVVTIWWHTI